MNDTDAPAIDIPEDRPQHRRQWSGAVRSLGLPLVALAAIVAAVWYLDVGRDDGRSGSGEAYGVVALEDGRNPTGRPPAAEIGRAAPDFRLERLGGGDLRLSDLRGKVVIVNFWATWCGPCRREMPEFVRFYATDREKGLEIVAVDMQESESLVRDFLDEFGASFPAVIDRSGGVGEAYNVRQLPVTYILDRDGIIRAVKFGEVSASYLRGELDKLL